MNPDTYAQERAIHNYEPSADPRKSYEWTDWIEWHMRNDPHPLSSYWADPYIDRNYDA